MDSERPSGLGRIIHVRLSVYGRVFVWFSVDSFPLPLFDKVINYYPALNYFARDLEPMQNPFLITFFSDLSFNELTSQIEDVTDGLSSLKTLQKL